jgi:hypothetical protein
VVALVDQRREADQRDLALLDLQQFRQLAEAPARDVGVLADGRRLRLRGRRRDFALAPGAAAGFAVAGAALAPNAACMRSFEAGASAMRWKLWRAWPPNSACSAARLRPMSSWRPCSSINLKFMK